MGLWQILKGEQPGLLKSVLHYRNAGQFGEYLIDYALQSNGIEGERVVLTNLYLPMKGKTTEIDLLMLHEKGILNPRRTRQGSLSRMGIRLPGNSIRMCRPDRCLRGFWLCSRKTWSIIP